LLFILLVCVFIFSPKPLDVERRKIIAIACSLLAALFTFFLAGNLNIEVDIAKTTLGKVGISCGSGVGVMVFVLWWWSRPFPDPIPYPPPPIVPTQLSSTPTGIRKDPVTPVIINIKGGRINNDHPPIAPPVAPPPSPTHPDISSRRSNEGILVMISEADTGEMMGQGSFANTISNMLLHHGMRVTNAVDLPASERSKLYQAVTLMRQEGAENKHSIPYAIAITGNIVISSPVLSMGIYLAAPRGSLSAINITNAKPFASLSISGIKEGSPEPHEAVRKAILKVNQHFAEAFVSEIIDEYRKMRN